MSTALVYMTFFAQCLVALDVIRSVFTSGVDAVHIKHANGVRAAAQFTSHVRTLENVVAGAAFK